MKTWDGRFYDDFDVCSTFCKFTSSGTPNEYNPLRVTETLYTSERATGNSHLLFYDDFADFSTFFKFQSSTKHSEYNPLWATVELNN